MGLQDQIADVVKVKYFVWPVRLEKFVREMEFAVVIAVLVFQGSEGRFVNKKYWHEGVGYDVF